MKSPTRRESVRYSLLRNSRRRRTTVRRDDLQSLRLAIPNLSHTKTTNEYQVSSFASEKKNREGNENMKTGLTEQLAKKLETIYQA